MYTILTHREIGVQNVYDIFVCYLRNIPIIMAETVAASSSSSSSAAALVVVVVLMVVIVMVMMKMIMMVIIMMVTIMMCYNVVRRERSSRSGKGIRNNVNCLCVYGYETMNEYRYFRFGGVLALCELFVCPWV